MIIHIHDLKMHKKRRIQWIDVSKGILAICVIVGHSKYVPSKIIDFIFSFHIPSFFILSGFLSVYSEEKNIYNFFLKKVKRILVPYLFFFLIGYFYWLTSCQFESKKAICQDKEWWHPFKGFLLGYGPDLYVSPGLWFLPCLFITEIIYHTVKKKCKLNTDTTLLVFFILIVIFYNYLSMTMPFSFHAIPFSLFFYTFGRKIHLIKLQLLPITKRIYYCLLIAPLWIYSILLNGKVDLNNAKYGTTLYLFLLNAIVGFFVIFLLSKRLKCLYLETIGKTMLCILGLNFEVLSIASYIVNKLNLNYNLMINSAITIITILISCIFRKKMLKYKPRLIGEY